MKYKLTAVFILLAFAAQSQQWHYGVKANLNLASINGNGMSGSYTAGYEVGGFVEKDLTSKWGFQPELVFSQNNLKKGSDFLVYYNTNGNLYAEQNVKLSYLNIPVMFSYKVTQYLSLLAGPQVGFLLYDNESLRDDGQGAFKKYEVSGNAGFQFNFSNVALSARYNMGLSNINDIDNRYKWYSRRIQAGIAVRIK